MDVVVRERNSANIQTFPTQPYLIYSNETLKPNNIQILRITVKVYTQPNQDIFFYINVILHSTVYRCHTIS